MANHIEACGIQISNPEPDTMPKKPSIIIIFRNDPSPDCVVIKTVYRDVSPITRDSPSIPVPSDYDESLPNNVLRALMGNAPRSFRNLP